MNQSRFVLVPIGWVESPLTDRVSAPRQGYEGSPEAWLVFEPSVLQGLEGIRAHIVAVHARVPHKLVNSGTGHARHIDIHSSGRMITGWLDDERPNGGTGGGST